MKKNKLLVMLACLGLLVTGCNKGGSSASTESAKPSTSSKQPSTQTTQSQPASTSSSQEEPPAEDDLYYSLPFDAAAKDSGDKWKKGYESVWTFKVSKDHAKMDFAFAAKMSSSSHGDRSLYTNHEGASSNDAFESNEANDGTCRIELKVNGVAQTVTTKTYEEAGLNNSDFVYFRVASFAVTKGEVVVSMKTHASTGYRLIFGDDARLFYPKADGQDPAYVEPPAAEGYEITFASEHCKLYYYEDEDYTVAPKEVTGKVLSRDSDGNITKYVAPDADGNGEVKPQINFKVVCDSGYEVDTNCIVVSGTEHNEWNHLDDIRDGIFSVTTIKANLTITVTPVAAGTLKAGYVATFVTEHCSIKVYTDKSFKTEDTATPYMSRNKVKNEETGEFPYAKGEDAQLSFEVVPEEGYEFVSGLDVGAEAKANKINYIAPEGYNKIKRNAENRYNLTKVSRDLAITIKCTQADPSQGGGSSQEEATGFEVTFALSHCSVVVYAGKIGAEGTVEDAGPKFYTRDKDNPANYTQVVAQAQFNFKVVPEQGYAFEDNMGEATSVAQADVTFIQGTFKNLKKNAGTYEYNLTQVGSALTITVNCALAA